VGTKNNPGAFDCYANAHPDEPMFVLLGRDPAAASAVVFWCALRAALGETELEVLAEADQCANAMNDWACARDIQHGRDPRRLPHVTQQLFKHLGLQKLIEEGREIWGPEKLDTAGVLARLVVNVGKLARHVRGATADTTLCPDCSPFGPPDECEKCGRTGRVSAFDLRMVMGNILFSVIRWCDDLGLNPSECCQIAAEQQRRFAAENPER